MVDKRFLLGSKFRVRERLESVASQMQVATRRGFGHGNSSDTYNPTKKFTTHRLVPFSPRFNRALTFWLASCAAVPGLSNAALEQVLPQALWQPTAAADQELP
jgi:hypothetical protein